MKTVRTKFIVAMLVTSLASLAVAGLVAQWRLSQKFSDVVRQYSFDAFKGDVAAYVETYGSWEKARRHEHFGRFVIRRHGGPGAGPPPQAGGMSLIPPPPRPGNRLSPLPASRGMPPRNMPEERRPPFRFLLVDPKGRVLLENPPYMQGATVPAAMLADASPVTVGHKVVGLAVPLETPNPSAFDNGYRVAVRDALLLGSAVAGGLAVLLGIVFSARLSRNLRRLTDAIRAMGAGDLSQRVDIRSRDEIGVVAEAFNRMCEDIRENQERIRIQSEELKELSVRDALTGLYNRRYFDAQVGQMFEHAKRYGERLSVVIGDIDHFKRINDGYSHAVGDEVLRQVARLLRSGVRQSDVVARYGGEEFVIAFPNTGAQQALALCEALRHRIETHPWSRIQAGLQVTLSMGLYDDLAAGDAEEMLKYADRCLYASKTGGRNRICHA